MGKKKLKGLSVDSIQGCYKSNKKFRDYVDAYVKKSNISICEAFAHKIIQIICLYYKGGQI